MAFHTSEAQAQPSCVVDGMEGKLSRLLASEARASLYYAVRNPNIQQFGEKRCPPTRRTS